MKQLYILSTIYSAVNYSFEVDSILSASKDNDVTVLVCDGCIGICNGNTIGADILCNECLKRSLSVLKDIKNITIIKNSEYFNREKIYKQFSYNSIKELNTITYHGIEIGYGVSSYYISLTRNLNPEITPRLKKILDRWLLTSMRNADIAENAITEEYDMVYVVNGRMFESKPFQEVAFSRCKHVILGESMTNLDGVYVKMNFENVRVHSVSGNCQLIEEFWKSSILSEEEKVQIATSFYTNRASAIATNDKIYVKDQQKNLMPDDWDTRKTNIVIFNSSEDEFAAIGGEFETDNLFDSQMSGIKFILDNIQDENIHFYLRIHPNLMNIKYKYHKDLYKLPSQYKNLTVIPGNSPISSYALLYACDRVITFGSTMGVEAAFAGKIAMVMRPSFYYYLDVNFVPKNKEEIIEFITGRISYIPNRENALKYSYYYYNNERVGSVNKECKLNNYSISFLGWMFSINSMNLKCSDFRMKVCAFLCLLGISVAKLIIPKKEK